MHSKNWKNYGFDFLSIFIAVISAFTLNNWNDNRKDNISANKILVEVSNGLEKDLADIDENMKGHRIGINACKYLRKVILGENVDTDSLAFYYFGLTRDYISVQNTAGYETLKSKGLELIDNDSLRQQMISLYEHDYNSLKKLEEEYSAMQFHKNYFENINEKLSPFFQFDQKGNLIGFSFPLKLSEKVKNQLLLYFWAIEMNRNFNLGYYEEIKKEIVEVQKAIKTELN